MSCLTLSSGILVQPKVELLSHKSPIYKIISESIHTTDKIFDENCGE